MAQLPRMDLMEALYTTRAMRRVDSKPIPLEAQAAILDAAIRAPNGGNTQDWRFVFLDDHELLAWLGDLYRSAFEPTMAALYSDMLAEVEADRDAANTRAKSRMIRSARWLAEHFSEVPLVLFTFTRKDASGGGSAFPAMWSAQLAARAFGIGSTLTVLFRKRDLADQVMRRLAVPDDGWNLVAAITFGYPLGRWGVAARAPAHEVSYRNRWGRPVGFEIEGPMWSSKSNE
jgi:nitroreductase